MEETERPSRGGKISLAPVVSSEKFSSSSSGTDLLPLTGSMDSGLKNIRKKMKIKTYEPITYLLWNR